MLPQVFYGLFTLDASRCISISTGLCLGTDAVRQNRAWLIYQSMAAVFVWPGKVNKSLEREGKAERIVVLFSLPMISSY